MLLKGFGILFGYLLTIIISREYGPNGLGVYSIAYTTMIIFSFLTSFGLTTSILRFVGQFSKPEYSYEKKVLYSYALKIIFVLSICFSLITYRLSSEIANYIFNDLVYEEAIRIVAVIAPFFTLNLINVEFLRGLKKITISEIFRTVLIPLICAILIIFYSGRFDSIQFPLHALGITILALSIISTLIVLKNLHKIELKTNSELSLKLLIKTSAPMMLIALSSYFIGNISVYVIQIFESKYEVGIFALSLKLSLFISFVLVGVNTVIAPKISELYWSENISELKYLIKSKTQFIFWLSFAIFLLITIFSNDIINMINKEFSSGTIVLIILAIGQLINASCGPVGLLLNMTGNESVLMRVTLSMLVLTVILNIIFIYHFSILGAAIATAMAIGIKNIILVAIAKKRLNITPFYIPFIKNI